MFGSKGSTQRAGDPCACNTIKCDYSMQSHCKTVTCKLICEQVMAGVCIWTSVLLVQDCSTGRYRYMFARLQLPTSIWIDQFGLALIVQ